MRRRIARLEWASRFRPIHITTLFLMPAPSAAQEDHFYHPGSMPKDPAACALFEDLLTACGIDPITTDKEALLRQFQHGGFFVAEAVECPAEPEDQADFGALLSRLMPTLERRIRYSYRPKSVLLLSDQMGGVAQALSTRLDAEVLLWQAEPVGLAAPTDAAARKRFREQVAALLSRFAPTSVDSRF